MKLLQVIKQWRDRRFQKRVLNALRATIAEEDGAIVFTTTVRSMMDIQGYQPQKVFNPNKPDVDGIYVNNGDITGIPI